MASRKSDGDRKTNRSSGGLQRSASVKGRRKFTHKYDLVKNGTHMHGWVTHITDPFTFYVRFNDWNTQHFIFLMSELQDLSQSFSTVVNHRQGHPYVAFCNGQWCRVLLEKLLPENQGSVFLVDVGERLTLNLCDLRELNERFLSLPAQASLCQLGCITLSKQNPKLANWSEESKRHFQRLMAVGDYVNIFVVGCYVGEVGQHHQKESKLYITVYVNEDESSVNTKLTTAGFGISVQTHEEPWHKSMRVKPVEDQMKYKPASSNVTHCEKVELDRKNSASLPMPLITLQVSICHVVDAGKFFVHTHKHKLHQDALNKVGPSLVRSDEVDVGKMYAVLDSPTKQWFRGQCRKPSRQPQGASEVDYDFHLVDRGHSKLFPISAIHRLPEELKMDRPMVWECRLNIEKPKGGWLSAATSKLLAQRDRTKITVHRIENGVRIVDVADEPTKPKPEPLSRKFFSNLFGVQKGASLNGQIVHVIDPDAFYIRLDESDSNKFAAFDVDMQTEYNQTDARCSYQVDVPRPGSPYVLWYNETWHRVLVEGIASDNLVTVFLVDVGTRFSVKSTELLFILDRFVAFPVQVVQCKMFGICPKVSSGLWTVESKFHFKQLVHGKRVTAFVEAFTPGHVGRMFGDEELLLSVVLYVGDDLASINARFSRAGHSISVRQHDFPSHHRVKEEVPSAQDATRSVASTAVGPTLLAVPDAAKGSLPSPTSSSGRSSLDSSVVLVRVTTPMGERTYDPLSGDESVSPVGGPLHCQPRKGSLGAESSNTSPVSCRSSGDENWRPFCSSRTSSALDTDGSKSDDADRASSAASDPATSEDFMAAEVAALESVKITGSMPQEGDYVMAVKFLMCQSAEAVYVRPLPYEAKYEELNANLQQSYRRSKVQKMHNIFAGARCAAFVYGQWIRAVVVDFNENLECFITNMDTGQPHQVTFEQIFLLTEPFSSVPKLALKCSLNGLNGIGNRPSDPDLVSKITVALLGADEIFISCRQRPKVIPSTMSVSIVYGHVKPHGKTLVNLNDQLVQDRMPSNQLVRFNNSHVQANQFNEGRCRLGH